MQPHDNQTLSFYECEAFSYAKNTSHSPGRRLGRFLDNLSPGASVLELGCGGGRDTKEMMERGFAVTPTDGSPAMAAEAARRLGCEVKTLLFEDISAIEQYDAVWANACLLHVPLFALSGILCLIRCALRPGGSFYASYKSGLAEGRDSLGRYYNDPSLLELRDIYQFATSWKSIEIESDNGPGYDNRPTKWLHATASKRN